MKEYLMTLISVALLNGVIETLSPQGTLRRYVRFVGSLGLICVMVLPILQAYGRGEIDLSRLWETDVEEEIKYDEIYNQNFLYWEKKNAEQRLKNQIIQEFSMKEEELEVRLFLEEEGENKALKNVILVLKETTVTIDPRELIRYVEQTLKTTCAVVYDP